MVEFLIILTVLFYISGFLVSLMITGYIYRKMTPPRIALCLLWPMALILFFIMIIYLIIHLIILELMGVHRA